MCIAIRVSPQATSEEEQNTKHKFHKNTAVVVPIGRHNSTLQIMQNTIIVELTRFITSFAYGVQSFHVS